MITSEPSEYAFSDPTLVELVIIDENSASWSIDLRTKSHEVGQITTYPDASTTCVLD